MKRKEEKGTKEKRADRGGVLIEFALVISLLVLISGRALNFGWVLYEQSVLVEVVQEATRFGAVSGSKDTAKKRADHLFLQKTYHDREDFLIEAECVSLESVAAGLWAVKGTVKSLKPFCFVFCKNGNAPELVASAVYRSETGTCS